MKSLLKLAFLAGLGIYAYRAVGMPILSLAHPIAQYRVQWEGEDGAKLFGSYVIKNRPTAPSKIEKVSSLLPYQLNFSAPTDAIVTASGATLNQGPVAIKIYKDGVECGKKLFVGSGAIASKVCQ